MPQTSPDRARVVRSVMSKPVHVLERTSPLSAARELMHAHAVRHLPVVEEGRVVGMVTLSDLYAAEAIIQADPDGTQVETIMAQELYSVSPSTPLAQVAAEMARRRLGSVVVEEGGALVGLFTTSDACRALAELLQTEVEA